MKRHVVATTVAFVCAGALAAAQNPGGADQREPQQPTQPRTGSQTQTESRTTARQDATTTLTGCIYREEDVPGRSPNVAERAGILEDYILADVRPAGSGAAGTTGAGAPAGAGAAGAGAGAATGTAGASRTMYKLEFVDDDKLRSMVGKRVEVTGRIDAEKGDTGAARPGAGQADRSIGPDRIELPEFEVTSIREIAGTCSPTLPSNR